MRAHLLLNVPVNGKNAEWRIVTGPKTIGYNIDFERLCLAVNNAEGSVDRAELGRLVSGALLVNNQPVIVVGSGVGNVFDNPEHPYAWEQKRSGGRGRRNQFNLAYCFAEGTTEIPSLSEIHARAKEDARRLIEAAYHAVEKTGRSEIPPEIVEFRGSGTHTGEWAHMAKSLRQGRAFAPFIDTGTEIQHLDFGGTVPLDKVGEAEHFVDKASASAQKKTSLDTPPQKMAFARVASIAAGCAMMIHGGISLWRVSSGSETKSQNTLPERSISFTTSMMRSGEEKNARNSFMLPMSEISAGMALTLWGVFGGRSGR